MQWTRHSMEERRALWTRHWRRVDACCSQLNRGEMKSKRPGCYKVCVGQRVCVCVCVVCVSLTRVSWERFDACAKAVNDSWRWLIRANSTYREMCCYTHTCTVVKITVSNNARIQAVLSIQEQGQPMLCWSTYSYRVSVLTSPDESLSSVW